MQASEWERIKAIFESALNVGEPERESYLASACGDNSEIRATVAELIANHVAAGGFLEDVSVRIGNAFSEGDLVGGRFRIVRFISHGGMGEVYEAFDEKLRVRRALKTLRPQLAGDTSALERFQREILVAHEVAHESLCRVHDLVEHRDGETVVSCLSMQLIEGESLLALLARERPLAPEKALPLIRQIATAIDVLHRNEIVHRDLKPSNVMLTRRRDGELLAIVTDFGLAKALEGRADFFESQLEFQAGAPYFMAPELLRGQRPSAASDIYSFGLLIDEMVTGSRAFTAESLQSL
jgi:serine/threonine protein kinase